MRDMYYFTKVCFTDLLNSARHELANCNSSGEVNRYNFGVIQKQIYKWKQIIRKYIHVSLYEIHSVTSSRELSSLDLS